MVQLSAIYQLKMFLMCKLFCRYRQILEKAIHFTDADQLESLKAFVEASMLCLCSFM